jgi:hypothetical protein
MCRSLRMTVNDEDLIRRSLCQLIEIRVFGTKNISMILDLANQS